MPTLTHMYTRAPSPPLPARLPSSHLRQVLRWQLDVEQNCDVYQCVEEWQLHDKNIFCMVFSEPLACLITGSEDATIHLHYLSGVVPAYNDVPLPVDFTGHEARVTGLALLKGNMLASISFDKTLRIWDLTTMKPVAVRGYW